MLRKTLFTLTTTLALTTIGSMALLAQEATSTLLPGGASALSETHGDWTVQCQVVSQDETEARLCVMGQNQSNDRGQLVLAIELQPRNAGTEGVLILPFGLAVTQPITLSVDAEGDLAEAGFSTCVPTGCLVPIVLGAEMMDLLRPANVLNVAAPSADGNMVQFRISLTGFTAASNRVAELSGS